jgi:hypothetical protein
MLKASISILTIACMTVGLAACGGDSEPSLDQASADVVAQADDVCAEMRDELDARGDFPVNHFEPENPSPEALPVVGDYFASANAATEKALQSLRNLEPPTEIQPELDALTDAMAAQLASAKVQVAAAQNSDVAGYTATLSAATRTIENVDEAADALGAERCHS